MSLDVYLEGPETQKHEGSGIFEQAFTLEQVLKARDWQTCACGRQDKRIPRILGYAPWDDQLASASVKFCLEVAGQHPSKARSILAQIEKHAARVLREVVRGKA